MLLVDYLKNLIKRLVESKFWLVFILIVLYVVCWVLDGLYKLHFDMAEFRQFVGWVALYVASLHAIDSGLNSPFGKPLGGSSVLPTIKRDGESKGD